MSAKVQKLEQQFINSAHNEVDSSQERSDGIFSGISVFVNGYTGRLLGRLTFGVTVGHGPLKELGGKKKERKKIAYTSP